jgi:hypothetical protein
MTIGSLETRIPYVEILFKTLEGFKDSGYIEDLSLAESSIEDDEIEAHLKVVQAMAFRLEDLPAGLEDLIHLLFRLFDA